MQIRLNRIPLLDTLNYAVVFVVVLLLQLLPGSVPVRFHCVVKGRRGGSACFRLDVLSLADKSRRLSRRGEGLGKTSRAPEGEAPLSQEWLDFPYKF